MTKRTTDEWQTLLGTELPERLWVEESDWDDEAWDVCVQHPDWGTRASIGSTHRKDVAHLFAAAPEAVAEVVRLRKELEALRRACIESAEEAERNAEVAYIPDPYVAVEEAERDTADIITRILDGSES